MKASDSKKQQQASAQLSSQPFFGAKSSGVFFSQSKFDSNPFFQPSGAVVQAKLMVGAVGDKYEQEADRVAANVVAKINDSPSQGKDEQPLVQRMGEEEEDLQMKPVRALVQRVGAVGGAVSTDFENQLNAARGGGQSLAPDLQAQMGQAMGADFSGVRVHADAQSDQLNQSIQAKAFTTGQDVFFRQGAYQPQSRGGQELIAHELTHVIQQSGTAQQIQRLSPQELLKLEMAKRRRHLGTDEERLEIDRMLAEQARGEGLGQVDEESLSAVADLFHDDDDSFQEEQSLDDQEQADIVDLELIVAQPQGALPEVDASIPEQELNQAQQDAPQAEALARRGAEADPVAAAILSKQMEQMKPEAKGAAQVVRSRPEDVAALNDLVIEEDSQEAASEVSADSVGQDRPDLSAQRQSLENILVDINRGADKLREHNRTRVRKRVKTKGRRRRPAQVPDNSSDSLPKKVVDKTSDILGPGMVAGPHTEAQGIHNYPSFDRSFGDSKAANATKGFSHFGVALSALGDVATLVSGVIALINNKSLPQESVAERLFRINEEYKALMTIHSGTFNSLKKIVDFTSLFIAEGSAFSAALTGVSAGFGIGLSGIILVQQGRKTYKAGKRAVRLHQLDLKSKPGKRLRDYAKAKQMRKAAVSGAQAVAAALGVSYGIATIIAMATAGVSAGAALAATPVGWVLLGGAALIGLGLGIYKLVRWWQRRKREKRAKQDTHVKTRERMAKLLIKLMKAPPGSKRRADAELIARTLNLSHRVILSRVGKEAIMNKLASW